MKGVPRGNVRVPAGALDPYAGQLLDLMMVKWGGLDGKWAVVIVGKMTRMNGEKEGREGGARPWRGMGETACGEGNTCITFFSFSFSSSTGGRGGRREGGREGGRRKGKREGKDGCVDGWMDR